jgi:hypothetical protein
MTRESFPPLLEWPSAGQTRTLLSVAVQAFGSRATQWHSWRRRLFRWAVLRCSLEGRKFRGSDLFDFNFALQARAGVERWEPYGVLGTAVLMNSYRAEIPGASAVVAYQGNRHSKFGLEGGGECAVLRRGEVGNPCRVPIYFVRDNFNRILGGVFDQLPDDSFLPFRQGSGRHWRK